MGLSKAFGSSSPLGRFFKEIRAERRALRTLFRRRLYVSPKLEREIVEQFHKLYYDSHLLGKTWVATSWMGVAARKCPLDLWVYQEILHELKPDVIVECGTLFGGSALFLASICDLLEKGRVITIDIKEEEGRPAHPRITYLKGSSIAEDVVKKVREEVREGDVVLVLLDSDHGKEHVLAELRAYQELVSPGSYIIVEDTCMNGHPVLPDSGPGPMEAVEEFLRENSDFVSDRSREAHYLTFNPKGYLKRLR